MDFFEEYFAPYLYLNDSTRTRLTKKLLKKLPLLKKFIESKLKEGIKKEVSEDGTITAIIPSVKIDLSKDFIDIILTGNVIAEKETLKMYNEYATAVMYGYKVNFADLFDFTNFDLTECHKDYICDVYAIYTEFFKDNSVKYFDFILDVYSNIEGLLDTQDYMYNKNKDYKPKITPELGEVIDVVVSYLLKSLLIATEKTIAYIIAQLYLLLRNILPIKTQELAKNVFIDILNDNLHDGVTKEILLGDIRPSLYLEMLVMISAIVDQSPGEFKKMVQKDFKGTETDFNKFWMEFKDFMGESPDKYKPDDDSTIFWDKKHKKFIKQLLKNY